MLVQSGDHLPFQRFFLSDQGFSMPGQVPHLSYLQRRHVDAFQASSPKKFGQHESFVHIGLRPGLYQRLDLGRIFDLDIVASGHDEIADPEVETGGLHDHCQLLFSGFDHLKQMTDVGDIGPYPFDENNFPLFVQNASQTFFVILRLILRPT